MLSSQSEFPKRIALESNLFKFKQQIQSHESGEGMNECLSSPSVDDESMGQSLLIEQAIVSQNTKKQEVSDYKKKGKNVIHTQEYRSKKQGKKVSSQAVQMHIGQSQLLRNIHEQQINANIFTEDDNFFEEEIEDVIKQKEQSHNDIIQSINRQNQHILQNNKQKKKRISIQSEFHQSIEDEEDQDIGEDSNSSNDDEEIEEDEENQEDGEDDQEEDQDDSDKDEQQIIKRKSSNTNINSSKLGKNSKSISKQNKKPGRKGNKGKYQDHKVSSQYNGKRCNNQFCKFPYKGDLKRVKIKFKSEYVHLCQKCTERFKQKCYCLYCGQVYYDSNEGDGKLWIQCEDCQYWLHQECEKDNGLSDIDSLIEDDQYKFYCLRCRDKNKALQQDKLQLNIQKAQLQIAKSLSGTNNDNNNSFGNVSGSPNSSNVIENYSSLQKSNKRQYKKQLKEKCQLNTNKPKCKVSLASLQKQLNKPIFAPKPEQPESKNIIKNSIHLPQLNDQNNNQISPVDQSTEPKKQKKICTEENKSGVSQNNTKSSPQVNQILSGSYANYDIDSTNHSSDCYSFQLFLKAKKQLELKQQQLNGITQFSLNQIYVNHSTQCENHIQNLDTHHDSCNNNLHHQNTQLNTINPYSHHNRQRKEDSMNYVELPYKKQTVKENSTKRIYYHYSILQELLTPLNIQLSLSQDDINVDLQILRGINIEEGKKIKDDDVQSTQLNFYVEDYSANQVNQYSSSQHDFCKNKQSPKQKKLETSELINLTPKQKINVFNENNSKYQNINSPISPNN